MSSDNKHEDLQLSDNGKKTSKSSDNKHDLTKQIIFVSLLPVIVVTLLWMASRPDDKWWPPNGETFAALLTGEVLVASILVAKWYQNLARSREIELLRKLAFAFRLGGTLALRPFLAKSEPSLTSRSTLQEYQELVAEPEPFRDEIPPSFFLAIFLMLALGLMPFWAQWMRIAETPNFLLGGPVLARDYRGYTDTSVWIYVNNADGTRATQQLVNYQIGALVCLSFAFLGAYFWCIIYLFRRIMLNDVNANAYQTISVRLLGSAIVALMLYHGFHLLQGTGTPPREPGSDPPGGSGLIEASIMTPVIGAVATMFGIKTGFVTSEAAVLASFVTGVMPDVTLRRIMEWMRSSLRRRSEPSSREDELSLERIEGIDVYTRMRLAEMGIYDVQGLASINPILLYVRTPFHMLQVMDWIGQAFALLYVPPERWKEVRKAGIRTAWQIERLGRKSGQGSDKWADGSDPSLDELMRDVHERLQTDPAYLRARQIVERIRSASDEKGATSAAQ